VDDVSLSTLATEKETAISAAKKNCHISSQKMPRRMPHHQPKKKPRQQPKNATSDTM